MFTQLQFLLAMSLLSLENLLKTQFIDSPVCTCANWILLLAAFALPCIAPTSFSVSVCLSVCINAATTAPNSANFDIRRMYENLLRKFNLFNRTKISGALHVLHFRHVYHNNTENNNTKERALFRHHDNAFYIYITVQNMLRHIGKNRKYRSLWGTNFVFIKRVSIHVKNAE